MLYLAVGTLWVVSIICMMFIAAYVYRLTKRQLSEGENSYFWTISRVLIVLFVGLSTFYFGVASRIESMPRLVAYQLQIEEVPLWSPEAWVSLSLAFAVCGALFALTDTLKNDFDLKKGLKFRWRSFDVPQLAMKVPYALTVSNRELNVKASALSKVQVPTRYSSQTDQFWALANVLVGLFTGCLLFVGLQTVSQLNFVQALGIDRDFGPGIALNEGVFTERIRPTATPTGEVESPTDPSASTQQDTIALADNSSTSEIEVAARSVEETLTLPEQRSALSVTEDAAFDNSADDGILPDSEAVSGPVEEALIAVPPPEAPTQQPLSDELPVTTQVSSLVAINEPLGVNARTGPGVTFDVITILQTGTQHPLLNTSNDGQWLNIQLPDATEGWVASWVVELAQ